MFDEQEIRKTICLMKPENQLFEIRIVYGNKNVYSGYFCEIDTLIRELKHISYTTDCNVYITLNSLNQACYDRTQKNKFERSSKATTSDKDVVGYDWLMVDLDPVRPAGTSSTDEQIEKAKQLGNKIFVFMQSLGFEKPLTAFSGNGVHLLYRVKIKNEAEKVKLLEKSLKTLNMLFSTSDVDVDMKYFNPSRICKLYGTLAQKGTNSTERPHRMSKILGNYGEIKATTMKYLEKLCELYPKQEKPQHYNHYQPQEFDLENWLSNYGIRYQTTVFADGTKYILDCCPFDSNHKGKDACLFQSRNGAIGFHCFHNSCADKTWQDVRLLYEPDAYSKVYDRDYRRPNYQNPNYIIETRPELKEEEGKPVFYTTEQIRLLQTPPEEYMKSGIHEIDRCMRGLKKTYVSVLSGLRASAKSSFISQMLLDIAQQGYRSAIFSGELTPKNFMKWMNLQAAGKAYVMPTKYENFFQCKQGVEKKISTWLNNKLYIYNNDYGNDFELIMEQMEKAVMDHKVDFIVLDNLMALNISRLDHDMYKQQSLFVHNLELFAKRTNTHVLFVAHPRKAMGFLRLEDISGSNDIPNRVDNAFIMHRINEDFKDSYKTRFNKSADHMFPNATNVIEICKDRDGGIQDKFIPLYFERETKRLKNEIAEYKQYDWGDSSDGFAPIGDEVTPFGKEEE